MMEQSRTGDQIAAAMVMGSGLDEMAGAPFFTYEVECFDADGNLKWSETVKNLVTDEGRTDLVNKYFKGSAYNAAFYLGLKGAGSVAQGNTAASHPAWSEVNPYTGNRTQLSFGAPSGTTTVSAVATVVPYTTTVAGPITVAGAFVQTANTGTSGVLYSVADFSAARTVYLNDVLNVTLTVSAT